MTARKITQNNSNLFEYWKENTCHWRNNQCDQNISWNWRCSVFQRKAFQAIIVYIFRIFFLFCISSCQITSKYLIKLSIFKSPDVFTTLVMQYEFFSSHWKRPSWQLNFFRFSTFVDITWLCSFCQITSSSFTNSLNLKWDKFCSSPDN